MKTPVRLPSRSIAFTAASILLLAGPALWAEEEFEEAELFLEFNSTDEDLGIHSSVDGGPWKKLEMEGPGERTLLEIDVRSRLRRQGLTQLFYESAEPTFEELDPAVFFARFPEGEYEIEGITLDGEELESIAELTHLLPAAPEASVTGMNGTFPADDECETIDVTVTPPVVIEWDEVTSSFDGPGFPDPEEITVHNYEVIVEAEIGELVVKTSTILPPEARSYAVPNAFIALSDQWKFEILVREESFNQTAIESCFIVN